MPQDLAVVNKYILTGISRKDTLSYVLSMIPDSSLSSLSCRLSMGHDIFGAADSLYCLFSFLYVVSATIIISECALGFTIKYVIMLISHGFHFRMLPMEILEGHKSMTPHLVTTRRAKTKCLFCAFFFKLWHNLDETCNNGIHMPIFTVKT